MQLPIHHSWLCWDRSLHPFRTIYKAWSRDHFLYNRTRRYLKYLPTLRVYNLWKSRRHISLMYRHPFWPRVPVWCHIPSPSRRMHCFYSLVYVLLYICALQCITGWGPPKKESSLTAHWSGFLMEILAWE